MSEQQNSEVINQWSESAKLFARCLCRSASKVFSRHAYDLYSALGLHLGTTRRGTSSHLNCGRKTYKDSPCDKPREIVSQPQFSKEELVKVRKIRAQGLVNISVSEDGDVIEAKVVRAFSSEAVDLLLAYAMSAKFRPRPGCGTTHTAINYTLVRQ